MRYLMAEQSWAAMRLAKDLETSGVRMTRTDSPEDLRQMQSLVSPDLTLIENPGKRLLRAMSLRAPVAVLAETASRNDITAWLNAGASAVLDLTAPSDATVAQALAVARRHHGLGAPRVQIGGLCIDLTTQRARVNGISLALAPKLYDILEHLALRPGRLVTRDMLLTRVYGLENEPEPRIFDVYIASLRRALAPVRDELQIETVRGAGFRLMHTAAEQDATAA